MGIGNKIRELRLKQGITQEILAQKIGVTPSAVGNYERDISFPKEAVLMRLFGALECSPNELLGEDAPFGIGQRECALLNKYMSLDEQGKERVDECAAQELERVLADEDEYEEIAIAARHGSGRPVRLKKRRGKSVFDLPDYGGGRK